MSSGKMRSTEASSLVLTRLREENVLHCSCLYSSSMSPCILSMSFLRSLARSRLSCVNAFETRKNSVKPNSPNNSHLTGRLSSKLQCVRACQQTNERTGGRASERARAHARERKKENTVRFLLCKTSASHRSFLFPSSSSFLSAMWTKDRPRTLLTSSSILLCCYCCCPRCSLSLAP